MSTPQFPPSFVLLQQEGFLISSTLALGLTELRAAHVQNKGAFYSALLNLSVGFERLLKAIVIIDHMLKNKLSAPSKKELQRRGHNVSELCHECAKIAVERGEQPVEWASLDSIDQALLTLLSDFAKVTRYHNLDALSASQSGSDPLGEWGRIIIQILCEDATPREKDKVVAHGAFVSQAIDDMTTTIMHGLDQAPLDTFQALTLPGLHQCAVKYAVYRLVRIIARYREIIGALSTEAYSLRLDEPPFPQMNEFLKWAWEDRAYALRKKRWP